MIEIRSKTVNFGKTPEEFAMRELALLEERLDGVVQRAQKKGVTYQMRNMERGFGWTDPQIRDIGRYKLNKDDPKGVYSHYMKVRKVCLMMLAGGIPEPEDIPDGEIGRA